MLGTLALKAIGLLALAAAAIASSTVSKQTKEDPVPKGFPANYQVLSYSESSDLAYRQEDTRSSDACDMFEDDCRYAHVQTGLATRSSIIYSCIDDQINQLVNGSCVQANCNGEIWGLTRMIPTMERSGLPATFRKTKRCGQLTCPVDPDALPAVDKTPAVLAEEAYDGSCPHPPPIGNHHLD